MTDIEIIKMAITSYEEAIKKINKCECEFLRHAFPICNEYNCKYGICDYLRHFRKDHFTSWVIVKSWVNSFSTNMRGYWYKEPEDAEYVSEIIDCLQFRLKRLKTYPGL